jgi:hypothetical protein
MTHAQAWDQIPWFINGSLDEAACARLEQHLHQCAACREEVRAQRLLLQAMNDAPRVEAMPPASLHKLWNRIEAGTPASARRAGPPVDRRNPASGYRVAAVALLALLAGVASTVMIQQSAVERPGGYRAVSDVAPVQGDFRVVFDRGMTLQQVQALLERTGLQIVAGPSASGVYTLAGQEAQGALEVLRADPGVLFAEPASPAGAARP